MRTRNRRFRSTVRPLRLVALMIGIGFVTAGCGKPCRDFGLFLIRPDGSDRQRVRPDAGDEVFGAAWLPGGERLVLDPGACGGRSETMRADGSDVRHPVVAFRLGCQWYESRVDR